VFVVDGRFHPSLINSTHHYNIQHQHDSTLMVGS
jgi:hypothetical protein